MYRKIINFIKGAIASDNHTVQMLAKRLIHFGNTSSIGNSIAHLCQNFSTNRNVLLNNFVLPYDHFIDSNIHDEEIALILDTLDNIALNDSTLSTDELKFLLNDLCTN